MVGQFPHGLVVRQGVGGPMGEIAGDIIDGSMCSWCGIYFKEPHGYPVVCKECGKSVPDRTLAKDGLQRAINDEG